MYLSDMVNVCTTMITCYGLLNKIAMENYYDIINNVKWITPFNTVHCVSIDFTGNNSRVQVHA